MLEDKYIGIALAFSGSIAIGTSFIITKKGLNDAGERASFENASDNYVYLRNPTWWAGMVIIANFAAYTFAPPILITPLGALSVIIGAILASFLLGEELGHLGRVGCTLCVLGSLIIVLHAPDDKDVTTVDEILHYAVQPGFMMYCFTVLVFCLVMIYAVVPRYGRSNPIVYISICSLAGSISIMAIKGFGIALKLTLGGNNQFTHPSTYVFAIVTATCIMVQMNYFNKALDTFSTNVVNPIYYVGFSTATLVASVIMFQGFNTDEPGKSVSLIVGFVVTFLGVHLLEISRKPANYHTANGHSSLENGLMNPRLSISGRMSIDGWDGAAGTPIGGAPPRTAGHLHRQSGQRQGNTLFDAYDDGMGGNSVGLERLPEVDEDYDDEVDERTRLRHEGHGQQAHRDGSRSGSGSPAGAGRSSR
ncbi:hypothetical protein PHLGIDRAFT_80017 [Phlebiopsis gigantea 11061_1 CR5-6]|uniref:Magnesium transporter n=1 Tax=Phlebiopsis gigantea (strain 11061_1 CR5-6) TaxID=745531 RepID=A0A0C3S2H8_PHLG1|nr:hypothetical protein PHLGIDRAFT_80017 [Phlebiopsis gigantea 11061_1 CR5-6]